jgi:uncharacterized alpha-E superfamily protein
MLSRLANNLFWMGRYLERAEYLARYSQVHYYSALDAPFLLPKEDIHASVLKFSGLYDSYTEVYDKLKEKDVLYYLFLDPYNLNSVKYNIHMTRENARSTRDLLLTELWEAINILYHDVNKIEKLNMNNFDDLTKLVRTSISVINGFIDNTLIHNEVWAILKAGQHIERSCQVARLLGVKWEEINAARDSSVGVAYENYLVITMLRSAESLDMSRIHFNRIPDTIQSFLFLLSNNTLPRSVAFNMQMLQNNLDILHLPNTPVLNDLYFKISRLNSQLQYLVYEDISTDTNKYLIHLLFHLHSLGNIFDKEYLS